MLVTILLPWLVHKGPFGLGWRVVMSWDVLKDAPNGVAFCIVCLWGIGLAAAATSVLVHGSAAARTQGALGAGGLLLCLIALAVAWEEGVDGIKAGPVVVSTVSLLFLLTQIVVTTVRLRSGASPAIRAVQAAASGLVILLTIVGFLMLLSSFQDMPGLLQKEVLPDLLLRGLFDAAMVGAMILILIHAAATQPGTDRHGRIGLRIVYGVLAGMALFLIVRPAMATKEAGLALLFTNVICLFAPVLALICVAAVKVVCEHVSRRRAELAGLGDGAEHGSDGY